MIFKLIIHSLQTYSYVSGMNGIWGWLVETPVNFSFKFSSISPLMQLHIHNHRKMANVVSGRQLVQNGHVSHWSRDSRFSYVKLDYWLANIEDNWLSYNCAHFNATSKTLQNINVYFIACLEVLYGPNCENNCSVDCAVPERCDNKTGECIDGCQAGWGFPTWYSSKTCTKFF